MKHVYKLTKEEKAMEKAVMRTGVRASQAQKDRYKKIAQNTTAKNKTITVRLTERNLIRLKAAAAREGLPYQTLVASLIHKHI
jgi:predicted DNA binding CopG/RHH family protein